MKMWGKLLKRFQKSQDGTAAVEFALVSVPFFTLLIGTIEIMMMFSTQMMLEGATENASRQIKTGFFQQAQYEDPEQEFRNVLCEQIGFLMNCDEIVIEMLPFETFAEASEFTPVYDEDGQIISRGFNSGNVNDTILIRTAFQYQMITPFIDRVFARDSGSKLLMTTLVRKTEPYDFEESEGGSGSPDDEDGEVHEAGDDFN